jgi:protein-export membrane protein SecD
MKKNLRWKAFIILIFLGLAIWQLSFTVKLQRLTPEDEKYMTEEEKTRLHGKALHLGLDLQGGMHLILQVDRSGLSEEEARDATDRALEILRNRIDQFGVYEPSIEKQGGDRIIIQLPGVVDRERAKSLIGKTALLEFKLVEEPERTNQILQEIDEAIHEKEILEAGEDTLDLSPNPLVSLLFSFGGDMVTNSREKSHIDELLTSDEAVGVIPKDVEFLWGNEVIVDELRYRPLHLLRKKAELTGKAIQDAIPGIGTSDNPNGAKVDLTMTREDRGIWSAITGANVNRKLAIVLDNTVYSAPVIRERIRGGQSQIDMGSASISDAKDLAIVLRAGALPAPVIPIEERSVGPTLGKDSVEKGIRSIMWGGILVLLFMLVYYSLSGAVANLALLLNVIFLLASRNRRDNPDDRNSSRC